MCWKIVFMESMCSCFDSFKTRWGKYSEADNTEKSFLSSGIDGMNINTLSCKSFILESLKMSGDSGECDKVHRKLFQGSPGVWYPAKCQCPEDTPWWAQLSSFPLHYVQQIFMVSGAKDHVLTIFCHSEREKGYPHFSPMQENCPICYSFHNVQSLSY